MIMIFIENYLIEIFNSRKLIPTNSSELKRKKYEDPIDKPK